MRVLIAVLITLAGVILPLQSVSICATPESATSLGDVKTGYLNGDANGDFAVDISDAVFILSFAFAGGPDPTPLEAADLNCDAAVDISDVVYLLAYIFNGGQRPCPTSSPSGEMTSLSACRQPGDKVADGEKKSVPECISWEYDGGSILKINHLAAGFNCCANISTFVSVQGQYIHIYVDEEFEYDPCPCMCLHDLSYQIINLPPGRYGIRVQELYVPAGDSTVNCNIDLGSVPTSGMHCVERSMYPWVW